MEQYEVNILIKKNSNNEEFGIGSSYDWKFLKNGLDGFGSFTNELNFVDNGIHDGGLITNNRMTKTDRTISCAYIYPSNNDTERKRVTAFFNAKDTYKVYITYGSRTLWADAYIYAYQCSMTSRVTDLMKLTITFTSNNPYLKSYDDFGADIASKTGLLAFPYLCSINVKPVGITGAVFNFAQTVLINNDGDVETQCKAVFKANGSVTNPSLIIDGKYVKVIDNMIADDVIEMDFTVLPPKVTKNGVNYIGHCDRTSEFTDMNLAVGDNSIQYSADANDANLSVSIFYNKLYASI